MSAMREQASGVGAFDAAAVQNAQTGGDCSIPRRDHAADEGVDFLRLLGTGRASRADRPHGLVSDDGLRERLHAGRVHDGRDLPLDDRARLPCFALLERFADADDRHEPGACAALNFVATTASVSP